MLTMPSKYSLHCMGGAGRSEDCGWVEISSHEARAGVVLLQVLVRVLMCGGQLPTAVAVVLICAAAADTGLQPLEVLLRHSLNSPIYGRGQNQSVSTEPSSISKQ